MRVTIEGMEYRAETATGLIDQIKDLHWAAGKDATAEEYLKIQKKSYKAATGRTLHLPWGSTEKKALAMFKAIAKIGGWEFTESE